MGHSARRVLVLLAAVAACRHQSLRWAVTDQEVSEPLPGDGLLRMADLTATRAISINAGPTGVWPWLVQIGQGRGGFYSYEILENLVGRADIHNADHVVPDWQELHVGDQVRLHPEVSLVVADLEVGTSLVLRGGVPMGHVAAPYDFTWAFCLRTRDDGSTRLLVRERYAYTRWWARPLVEGVSIVSFVMTHRMLRGIKVRAERTWAGSAEPDDQRRIVVPAISATMAAASARAPTPATPPVASTKRRQASILGPIDPAGNLMPASSLKVV
jgi:hypothetical protein